MRNSLKIYEENLSISDLFDKFIYYKKASNKSADTINYYNASFRFFGKYFDVDKPCTAINEAVYLGYSTFLLQSDIEKVTVNTRLRGIKTFFNYAMRQRTY